MPTETCGCECRVCRCSRYHEGKFENATANIEPHEVGVTAMCRRKDGAIMLSALTNGTLVYSHERLEKFAPAGLLRGSSLVISMAATQDARVWLGTIGTGLFSMDNGRLTGLLQGLPDKKINCLPPLGDWTVLVGTDNGVVRWDERNLPQRVGHLHLAMSRFFP